MREVRYLRTYTAVAAFLLSTAFSFAGFLARGSAQTPTPSPSPSPTASGSPTVVRVPSPTPLPGVQNFHQWGSITVFNGLPSDSVRAIAQTQDGVMWFGTDNGLARYDGRRIQSFSMGSADANRVLVIKLAATGELWIGTRAGAFVYAGAAFQPVRDTQGIGVTAILLGREIYLGTDAGFVLRSTPGDGGTFVSERVLSEPLRSNDGGVLAITGLSEADGSLFAATAGRGVFVLRDGSSSEFATAPRPVFVNSLVGSTDRGLWLGADAAKGVTGIYRIESGSKAQRIAAPTANVLALESNESGLWAGTERYGLFHIADSKLKNTYTFENTSGGLRSNTVYTLFTDREGVIWIGTNRGVSRFDRRGPLQQTVSEVANSNFIRVLFRAFSGTIYAGSNRGLFVKSGDKWAPVPAYGNRPIFAINETRPGKLIVGTSERINGSTYDVRSFADFQGTKYAAAAGLGLVQVSDDSYSLKHPNVSINTVFAGRDKLWIGTAGNGLYSFDGDEVRLEVSPDVLKSGMIWRIVETENRTVWVAGEHGVFAIGPGGVAEKVIDVTDVRDVFVDGDVWAATTTSGLMHAKRDERFGWIVASIGFEQGLPSEKAFSILPIDEGLLVATNRGVVTYKPGSIAPKLIATRILSQRVHDLSELRSTIDLDYPQDSLLFEVAGQSGRTFPEEFQYGFILRSSNGDVLERRLSRDPQYAPSDLKPGTYRIEAIAFDRDLLSSEPLTMQFSVAKAPFPWTAAALGFLLAIAVIAFLWAILERRQIVLRNRELAEARLDLANEAERERRRIARDLHDQTLADLRDLMMKGDRADLGDNGFRKDIESISTEIRRICEDLSPSVLENVGLLASLEFLIGRTVDAHTFEADESIEDELTLPFNVQLQVYRIFQEVLTNLKRHANASLVEMRVTSPAAGVLKVEVTNDGTPFVPAGVSRKDGRGINGIRARASMIKADADWGIDSDGRQRFTLTVPG